MVTSFAHSYRLSPSLHRSIAQPSRMTSLPFNADTLLQPLSEEAPSGPDLEYDARFVALEQAGAGKPERQYGDKLYPAEPPDWGAVQEQALVLAQESRDLRVAVWLTRSAARTHGLSGAAEGLRLVQGLLTQLWTSLHPQLDASDNNDPTMRLSALGPLTTSAAGLADLRAATLAPVRGSLTWRELELGLGQAEAASEETVPTEAGVLQALQTLLAEHADLAATIEQTASAAEGIHQTLETQLGHSYGADLSPLLRLVKLLKSTADKLTGTADAQAEGAAQAQGLAGGSSAIGGLANRADVVRQIERICEWIERNEPTNPAPILLRRAQRLMNKSFMEIIRDLAPDGVAQIENLAGPEG
jgi:type VI secretion system protein ImpA